MNYFKKKRRIGIFIILILLLLLTNIYLLMLLANPGAEKKYDLLDSDVAAMDLEQFIESQKHYQSDFFTLKEDVNEIFYQRPKGEYGFFFENLNTGAWIGINEKQTFYPASILKLIPITSIFKRIEDGDYSLTSEITITKADISYDYGPLGYKVAGYNMTLIDLINQTIFYSDNTGERALIRLAGPDAMNNAFFGIGIPYDRYLEGTVHESGAIIVPLSAKEIGNIFRTLYYSTYLKRPSSQLILSLLANTNFKNRIKSGVPPDIMVAHKVGLFVTENEMEYDVHHDCGIVYDPHNPYLICVLTQGLTEQQANTVIADVSKKVYDFISLPSTESRSFTKK